MQTLTLDPPVPMVLPEAPLLIALVGCGGTGSYVGQSLARIAAHARDSGGPEMRLVFLDGDIVEYKNVGRQLFCVAEIGLNKAETLAARMNAALGLKITAVPQMATRHLLTDLMQSRYLGILVGAVDSPHGRKAMHDALAFGAVWRLWIDSGNHDHAGQVLVGTTTDREELAESFKLGGLCTALPAPSLVMPDLLQAPAMPAAPMNCADDLMENRQSLMVNFHMAAIVSEYLYKLILQRRITTFRTVVDLGTLSMRSTPITASNIAEASGVSVDLLNGTKSAKPARKRAEQQGVAA